MGSAAPREAHPSAAARSLGRARCGTVRQRGCARSSGRRGALAVAGRPSSSQVDPSPIPFIPRRAARTPCPNLPPPSLRRSGAHSVHPDHNRRRSCASPRRQRREDVADAGDARARRRHGLTGAAGRSTTDGLLELEAGGERREDPGDGLLLEVPEQPSNVVRGCQVIPEQHLLGRCRARATEGPLGRDRHATSTHFVRSRRELAQVMQRALSHVIDPRTMVGLAWCRTGHGAC
jgi:hypothetical protein